jgi:hypothetical protein
MQFRLRACGQFFRGLEDISILHTDEYQCAVLQRCKEFARSLANRNAERALFARRLCPPANTERFHTDFGVSQRSAQRSAKSPRAENRAGGQVSAKAA